MSELAPLHFFLAKLCSTRKRGCQTLVNLNESKPKKKEKTQYISLFCSKIEVFESTNQKNEYECRLADVGFDVGVRMLELLVHREKAGKRENRILGILSFLHTNVWKSLFGKTADSLERGTSADDEYMISDHDLLVNRYISVPRDMGHLNCGSFAAGIVEGVLKSAGFPARVTAHSVASEGLSRPKTTILIKFAPEVIERDERLGS